MNDKIMYIVDEAIKKWSQSKKAYIRISTYIQEIEEFRKLTGVHRVERILEIGSGSGWFLITAIAFGFAQFGLGVDPAISKEGTDIDEIQMTRSIIEKLNLKQQVRFYVCTFEDFLREASYQIIKHEKYDLLVFRNVLHHIYPRSKEHLKEQEIVSKCIEDLHFALSLLNNSGYLYVVEATRPSKFYALLYNFYRTIRRAPMIDWISKRTPSEWMQIFEKSGFKGIGITKLPIHHPFLNTLRNCNVNKILSHQFLIVARVIKV